MPLKLRDRQKQKMFDSVTERIKNQTQGGLKVNPETGVRYEEPLEEKHPGLTIGLMAAQPGTILEKVLAPSVYKGMINSINEGNLSEALMSTIVPIKTKIPIKIKTKGRLENLKQRYNAAIDEVSFIDEAPIDLKIAEELKKDFPISKIKNDIHSEIASIKKELPELERKADKIYKQIKEDYDKHGWDYDFDIRAFADGKSGLQDALDRIEYLYYNIDPYQFAPLKRKMEPLLPPDDNLPFKQGGKLKRK